MESFGAYLKGLREEKGKTLEQISDSTKIAVSNLALLESDRYDLLPPRVFVKGFIRSYIRELEMNPDEALARFDEFVKHGELPDYSEEEHPVFHQEPVSGSFIHNPWFTVVLTAAGVVSLVILLATGITRLVSFRSQLKGWVADRHHGAAVQGAAFRFFAGDESGVASDFVR